MIAFGWDFFHHFGHVLDGIVIPVSIILEFVIGSSGELLIIVRSWRLLRIVHGIYETQSSKGEAMKHKVLEAQNQLKDVEKQLTEILARDLTKNLYDEIYKTQTTLRGVKGKDL